VLPYRWENVGRDIRDAIDAYQGRKAFFFEQKKQNDHIEPIGA
jgi:hypothetical protein